MRDCVSVEQCVAVTLWTLATCTEYCTISHLFGLSRSAVCLILHDNCKAIVKVLQRKYMQFPRGERLQEVVNGFKSKLGMIQCCGAIDGSHIPVMPPALHHTDYYNRKGWYSIILQGIVDHNYLFENIYIGWPGSVHDAHVFAHSSVYKMVINSKLLQGEKILINGKQIPLFLIGDLAYPLASWLMKPFPHNS